MSSVLHHVLHPRRSLSAATVTATVAAIVALVGCRSPSGAARLSPVAAPDAAASSPAQDVRAPQALAIQDVRMWPGESMEFELSLGEIVGGRTVLAVGEPGMVDGTQTVIVRSLTESAGVAKLFRDVRDDMQTWMNLTTGLPMRHASDLHSSGKRFASQATFGPHGATIVYQRHNQAERKIRRHVPDGEVLYDLHSALGALRGWDPTPGDAVHFYSLNGRWVWYSELEARGVETVRTAMGLHAAIVIRGTSVRLMPNLEPDPKKIPRKVTVWVSDDSFRMPLRMTAEAEYGRLQAELIDYRQPPANMVSQR